MRFSYRMVPEVYQLFWAAMARGEFITDAAVEAGTYRKQGTRWLVAAVSVIIDSPDAEQLSPVMAAIYGLTPREQQVVEARRLAVHEQEYLRHIFAKVGVAAEANSSPRCSSDEATNARRAFSQPCCRAAASVGR
jgi:hypothetical protein